MKTAVTKAATKIPGMGNDSFQRSTSCAAVLAAARFVQHYRARRTHHPESLVKIQSFARSKRFATSCLSFTGVISDLGGPTANMYRIGCKSPEIESACRKPSCVYPGMCVRTSIPITVHSGRRCIAVQAHLKGVKKILIGSGLRYDLAVQSHPST